VRGAGGGEPGTGKGEQGAYRTVGAGWADRRWDVLALVAVVVGALLRARHFFTGQSLWLDEAMLALNILSRSCRELFGALAFDQAAPPLYLCASRAVALPFGGSELGLRLPSLAAGLLALVLVWRVGRAIVGPESAAWATWLLAISPMAIYYSDELKPYMLDAMVAILVLGLAWRVVASPRDGPRTAWLAGVGLVALLTSFTAPLVLGATGVVLMLDGAVRHDRAAILRACGLGVLWLITFAALYLTLYRSAGASEFLNGYWSEHFLSFGPAWRASVVTAVTGVTSALPIPPQLVRARYLLPAAVVVVGFTAWRSGWRVASLLLFPFLALFLAAVLRRYPLGDRLVLFLAPAAVLLAATGLVAGARLAGLRRASSRGVVLGLVVAGAGLTQLMNPPPRPGGPRTARALVQRADSVAQADLVLVTRHGAPTWLYYTTDWQNPDRERLTWFSSRFGSASPLTWANGDLDPPPPVQFRLPPRGAPNLRPEALAPSSGLGFRPGGWFDTVYASWGSSQVVQLRAHGAGAIWVYGVRPAELSALAEAWGRTGGRVVRHGVGGGAELLELRGALPSEGP
jgi:4-amino-4-deoxy-L-arabinose transferase-like glycosyltransferase